MKKEKLHFEIKTKVFERILLSMQHITQRIQKGKKCVLTLKYDPNNFSTEITKLISGKEIFDYEIRTEGFEELLCTMQHITQQIRAGEKCAVTFEYDPNALFAHITTVIERSPGMESNPGKFC